MNMSIKCDCCEEPATVLLSWGPENRQKGKFCQLHADDTRDRLKYVGKVILTTTPLYGTDGKIEVKVEELEDLETPDLPPIPSIPNVCNLCTEPATVYMTWGEEEKGKFCTKHSKEMRTKIHIRTVTPVINITTVMGENVKGFDTKERLKPAPQENPLQEHEATYFRLRGKLNRWNWKKEIVPLTELWSALTFREKRIQELEEVVNHLKEGIEEYRIARADKEQEWNRPTHSVEGWEGLIGQYICGPRPDNLTPPEVKVALEGGLKPRELDPAEVHTLGSAPRRWVEQDAKPS